MKRFFKTGAACALALALMSTSAFAAVSGGTAEFVDGKLNVTIEGTDANEQVALLVLKGENRTETELAGVENTDIAYIDQKTGGASLAFNGINVGETTAVTVFAGSTKTPKAIRLGSVSATQYTLTASPKSFNVAAGVKTTVDLTLTDQDDKAVTSATVEYKLKDALEATYEDATGVVSYEDGAWKFNFNAKGTYQVKFTNGTAYDEIVVSVYEKNLPVVDIGKEGETAKPFVMQKAPDSTKVVAAVKVTIDESQSGVGQLIWSITTTNAEGVKSHYYSTPSVWNTTNLSGALAIGCKFDNNTGEEVTAVNVIYKDKTGKVFFTDESDASRERK